MLVKEEGEEVEKEKVEARAGTRGDCRGPHRRAR